VHLDNGSMLVEGQYVEDAVTSIEVAGEAKTLSVNIIYGYV